VRISGRQKSNAAVISLQKAIGEMQEFRKAPFLWDNNLNKDLVVSGATLKKG